MLCCLNLAVILAMQVAPFSVDGQDVPFLESPEGVVERMLELAEVTADDIVYDLGSGDGRIVLAAAVRQGANGVGIELDPELVELSNAKAVEAGVEERVRFVVENFFEADFSEATVVTVYLLPKVLRELRPVLVAQLAPGTRIVSHKYRIDGWTPAKRAKVEGRSIFLYLVPDRGPLDP